MTDYGSLDLLSIDLVDGIATVTIDNPPMNLLTVQMMREFNQLHRMIDTDPDVRVIVFVSADPDFFIAHAEAGDIEALDVDLSPPRDEIVGLHRLMERWRHCSKPTIAQIEGRTRGGGSEFVMSLDMRYAATHGAVFSQPEAAVGIIAAGSGTQRLAELCGRDRALEIALGCGDYTAEEAERYGWVTRAVLDDQIAAFVADLARRIASFPPEAIEATKRSILAGCPDPVPGLIVEEYEYRHVRSLPAVGEQLRRIEQAGFGSRKAELGSFNNILQGLVGQNETSDQRPD